MSGEWFYSPGPESIRGAGLTKNWSLLEGVVALVVTVLMVQRYRGSVVQLMMDNMEIMLMNKSRNSMCRLIMKMVDMAEGISTLAKVEETHRVLSLENRFQRWSQEGVPMPF